MEGYNVKNALKNSLKGIFYTLLTIFKAESEVEKMEESLEGLKKRIECLEIENKEIREYSRKLREANKRLFDKWNDMEQLLTSISTCARFVDKEKAFDEIMQVFSEVEQ